MIAEFNEDVPSGINETAGLAELLGGTLGADAAPRFVGDVRSALADAFDDFETIGLAYATAYSEDLQHVEVLGRWLRDAGHRTVLATPSGLSVEDGVARVHSERVDALFRYYPAEWMHRLPNYSEWGRLSPQSHA